MPDNAVGNSDAQETMSPPAPRFFCDTMLGRLAKWLRLLGYDAAYLSEVDDWEMLRLCRREGRMLLTRDRGIMERWHITRGMVEARLIHSDDTAGQLAAITDELSLQPQPEPRCPVCNQPLNQLAKEDSRDKVPLYVYETQNEFRTCAQCNRIYWKATHWENIEQVRHDPTSF